VLDDVNSNEYYKALKKTLDEWLSEEDGESYYDLCYEVF
jgi:hypothetical protein